MDYHLKRADKEIKNEKIINEIIKQGKYLSLALCNDNIPYLVTLSYGYDFEKKIFYIHSATEGRKIEYLTKNPNVYGQIIMDGGYRYGKCSHSYRSLNFEGIYEELTETKEKTIALNCMIRKLEDDPEKVLNEQVIGKKINARIGMIKCIKFSAKGNY